MPFAKEIKIYPKTKRVISETFFSLLEDKDYHEISVKEICQSANFSRRTFYRYFKNKHEIVSDYSGLLLMEYLVSIDIDFNLLTGVFIEQYFTFWHNHKILCKLVQDPLFSKQLIESLNVYTISSVHHYIETKFQTTENLTRLTSFVLGGVSAVLLDWINDGCQESAEQMSIFYVDMISEYLRVLFNGAFGDTNIDAYEKIVSLSQEAFDLPVN